MSAYVVNREHIDVLVRAAISGPTGRAVSPSTAWNTFTWYAREWRDCETMDEFQAGYRRAVAHEQLVSQPADRGPDTIGDMLLTECMRSVSHRYPDDLPSELPGARLAYWLETYRYTEPRCSLSPVAILKAIDCYEYQSCEHPEWQSSEARRFCDTLGGGIINTLDGYDQAPWTWDADTVAKQRERDRMTPDALAAFERREQEERDAETAAFLRAYAD